MLKLRIITALALLPLVIGGIFFTTNQTFAVGFAIVMAIGAFEWSRLAGFSTTQRSIFFLLFLLALAGTAYLYYLEHYFGVGTILAISVLFWIVAFVHVLTFPDSAKHWEAHGTLKYIIGLILLIPTWLSLVLLHDHPGFIVNQAMISGPWLVMTVLLLVWAADTGAYFAGRRFGKRKLAPQVSPGKSWEGVYGGLLLVALIFVALSLYVELSVVSTLLLTLIAIITAGFSVVGDLTESMFKRRIGLKDSGKILPGHGGILDRLDSLTAAAPLFAAALLLIEGKL